MGRYTKYLVMRKAFNDAMVVSFKPIQQYTTEVRSFDGC